jgi:hypothetical protein
VLNKTPSVCGPYYSTVFVQQSSGVAATSPARGQIGGPILRHCQRHRHSSPCNMPIPSASYIVFCVPIFVCSQCLRRKPCYLPGYGHCLTCQYFCDCTIPPQCIHHTALPTPSWQQQVQRNLLHNLGLRQQLHCTGRAADVGVTMPVFQQIQRAAAPATCPSHPHAADERTWHVWALRVTNGSAGLHPDTSLDRCSVQ